MNEELISMVRSIVKHGADWRINKVLNRAADALEAADKRIAELEAQEPTEKQVVDYCSKRCLVIVTGELFQRMKATFSQMPKEGEWIWENYYWHCSVCGENPTRGMGYVQGKNKLFRVCPNCGAKMKGANRC